MKEYSKHFVGKGTQVPNLPIIKATVKVTEFMKHVHVFEGDLYCTFEVAKLQEPDKFGRDHTVYCTTLEEVPEDNTKKTVKKPAKK
ncbi:hypothetical protein [Draconibacterium mangrovi]|uniref:hypothetical protein n=1 Tax=Draconibacterium mangrovi TaxID=2697469 RepID=UPI0013D5AEEB|nr:hypothetical protein [Draconibacterium mangrovi]